LKLAIDWRNRKVHSLADEKLKESDEKELISNAEKLRVEHRGLDVKELITHYKSAAHPSFKEAASIIKLVQDAVSHFDGLLLAGLDISEYVRDAVRISLSTSSSSNANASLKHACAKTWGNPKKRREKALRALRLIGVHETQTITVREVPDDLIEHLTGMTSEEAYSYFSRP